MGWGDEIMVTAQARQIQERDLRPVAVMGRDGQPRWHPIWDNNPRLVNPRSSFDKRRAQWLHNYSGRRPYLDYARFDNRDKRQPYVYTSWRVEPGEIYLTEAEKALGRRYGGAVIVEPNVKAGASPNKQWGRWEELAAELADLPLVQVGPAGTPTLAGVDLIVTRDVREASAVLSGASIYIGPEGGLHHAAAALGVRGVVIFGGFISPATTGYDLHTNLFTGAEACGMRVPCRHCAEAMARITPQEVAAAARAQLERWKSAVIRSITSEGGKQ